MLSATTKHMLELLTEVSETRSRNQKKELLGNSYGMVRESMVKLFEYVKHPYKQYYQRRIPAIDKFYSAEILKEFAMVEGAWRDSNSTIPMELAVLFYVLDQLHENSLAGTKGKQYIATYLRFHPELELWVGRVLRRDLRVGVQGKTIREALPEFDVPGFGAQRCLNYKQLEAGKRYFIEPKWDGVFCYLIPIDGELKPLSRSGKPHYNMELIVDEIKHTIPNWDQYVYNGEAFAGNITDSVSITSTQRLHPKRSDLVLKIWDLIPIEEWESKEFKLPLKDRVGRMEGLLANRNGEDFRVQSMADERMIIEMIMDEIVITGATKLFDQSKLEVPYPGPLGIEGFMKYLLELYVQRGREGMIIKDVLQPASIGRNGNWLRSKPVETADLPLIGVLKGNGRLSETCGKIVLRLPNGKTVKCGSGLSDKDRAYFWSIKDNLEEANLIIEVKYKEDSAKGRLREPIFVRIRHDKS